MKRATIKDVAALAGVSFATVSRALDDRPEISGETKRRVREACAQLGYVPNAAARGLAGQATHTLGLIVPDVSNPYFSGVVTAIERRASESGYRVLVSNSLRDEKKELRAVENLLARQIDGLIISALSPASQHAHSALVGSLPCVYLGVNHDSNCSYIMVDNEVGAYEAARYLLELGHRRIVYLGGRDSSLTLIQRRVGFFRAMREYGLSGEVFTAEGDPAAIRQWSRAQAIELFRAPDRPDAIFAFSDMIAMKVLEAAEECGVKVPEDVSLMGFDNMSLAALPRIALTTVSQHKFDQGRLAVDRLLEQIGGERRYTADIMEPELIIRSTCKKRG